MTKILATGVASATTSASVRVEAGQYMLGVGGSFSGATVMILTNIGPATELPISDASFTEPGVKIIWLPECTLQVQVTGGDGSTSISAAMGELKFATDNV